MPFLFQEDFEKPIRGHVEPAAADETSSFIVVRRFFTSLRSIQNDDTKVLQNFIKAVLFFSLFISGTDCYGQMGGFSFNSTLTYQSPYDRNRESKYSDSVEDDWIPAFAGMTPTSFWRDSHNNLLGEPLDTTIMPSKEEIDYTKLSIVGGALLGGMATIHIYQQNGWWKDNRTSFHFQEDLGYSLGVDKIGHFHGAAGMTYVISRSLEWANIPEEQAWWYGAGGSLLFQTFLEVEDGFSTWGFDRVDFAVDVAGAFWPVARRHFPVLNTVELKFSYHPSDLLNRPGGAGFQGQQHLVMDDYEGQTFWLSTRFNTILPKPIDTILPDFLSLAIGYGARDIVGTSSSPYRVWFVAFDLDMTKILPQDIPFFKIAGEVLNHFHMPMPAVQVSPNAIWYGLYF
ncbi:MAG: DUF2279 domain-containing protein [Bacteroidetes bacterium]|nr:MAG: DUF2279 domain-containing protein [Bacteroidota bacterium]